MQLSKFFILFFLIVFASCKKHGFTIDETKIIGGRSQQQFIEGSIMSGLNSNDTILYYKFDLITDSAILKENSKLNIGINYSLLKQDSSYSVNLGFKSIPPNLKHDKLQILNSGNRKIFSNFIQDNLYKGGETSVGFMNDKYFAPTTSTLFTSEVKMKEFLEMFENEIFEALNNNDKVVYSSVSHLDGYFQNISMTVTFK